jgi:hypothetical protein
MSAALRAGPDELQARGRRSSGQFNTARKVLEITTPPKHCERRHPTIASGATVRNEFLKWPFLNCLVKGLTLLTAISLGRGEHELESYYPD